MRRQALVAKASCKFIVTTDSNHKLPVAANLLAQNFEAEAPNQKWAGDITYLMTSEGWLYLAVAIDLHSRSVIGWSVSTRMIVTEYVTPYRWRYGVKASLKRLLSIVIEVVSAVGLYKPYCMA